MNKTILSLLILLTCNLYSNEKEKYLNQFLDKYIKINSELTSEMVESAKETQFKKVLVPLEKIYGDDYVKFLKEIKMNGTEELKIQIIKIEIMSLKLNSLYDAEYGEEKEEIMESMMEFKDRLMELSMFEAKIKAFKKKEEIKKK